MKLNWTYTSRPDIQKIYTTEEIAEYLDTTCSTVRNIASYYKIERCVSPTKTTRAAFYTWDAVRKIKEHYEAKKDKVRQMLLRQKYAQSDPTQEELEILHPLVKDKEYLKFSVWPDIEPECFKDLDKE